MRYLYLSILLTLTGCSTVLSLNDEMNGGGCQFPGYVYAGAIGDVLLVHYAITDDDDDVGGRVAVGLYGVIDFPFSAVADTVLLPLTIVREFSEC